MLQSFHVSPKSLSLYTLSKHAAKNAGGNLPAEEASIIFLHVCLLILLQISVLSPISSPLHSTFPPSLPFMYVLNQAWPTSTFSQLTIWFTVLHHLICSALLLNFYTFLCCQVLQLHFRIKKHKITSPWQSDFQKSEGFRGSSKALHIVDILILM